MDNYIITNGQFQRTSERKLNFDFQGSIFDWPNPQTQKTEQHSTGGEILFGYFREGTISFDISFDNVFPDTWAGILLNYANKNSEMTFYRIGIRNFPCAWSAEYFSGKGWVTHAFSGQPNLILPNTQYSVSVEVGSGIVTLNVNGINVLEYLNMTNDLAGTCGLSVWSGSLTHISNITIKPKKPKVFCVMKFEKDFDDLYKDVIKPQCDELGLQAVRADEYYASTPIIQDIINEINEASIIICDVTMDNPNVFYELGYAHALQKPIILLADRAKREHLPFDISGYRTIFYSNTIAGKSKIEEDLRNYINTVINKKAI